MEIKNVGVVSPGDMGSAIAKRIKESGKNVYTALDGRSERTKALGARSRARPTVGSMDKLVVHLRAGDLGHQSRRGHERRARTWRPP